MSVVEFQERIINMLVNSQLSHTISPSIPVSLIPSVCSIILFKHTESIMTFIPTPCLLNYYPVLHTLLGFISTAYFPFVPVLYTNITDMVAKLTNCGSPVPLTPSSLCPACVNMSRVCVGMYVQIWVCARRASCCRQKGAE